MADISDPFTTPLMAKVLAGIGGFIGGATFMAFYRPKNVWDAAVRSSVCTSTAIIGSAPLLVWLGISTDTDHILAAAAVIGFCSWSILTLIAHTLMDIQDDKVHIKLPDFIEKREDPPHL